VPIEYSIFCYTLSRSGDADDSVLCIQNNLTHYIIDNEMYV